MDLSGLFCSAFALVCNKHSNGYSYLVCLQKAILNFFLLTIEPWKLMTQVAISSSSWRQKIRQLRWHGSRHKQMLKATREKRKFTTSVSSFKQNLNQVWQTERVFSDVTFRNKAGMGQMNYSLQSSQLSCLWRSNPLDLQIWCSTLNHSKPLQQIQSRV